MVNAVNRINPFDKLRTGGEREQCGSFLTAPYGPERDQFAVSSIGLPQACPKPKIRMANHPAFFVAE